MKDRIKALRKELKMSQEALGNVLGITGSGVSRIEAGDHNLSEQNIKLLGAKLNVSEEWLRTGEGSMFKSVTHDEKVADFFSDLMKDEPASFRRRLINVLSDLDVEQWEALAVVAEKLVAEYGETKKADPE